MVVVYNPRMGVISVAEESFSRKSRFRQVDILFMSEETTFFTKGKYLSDTWVRIGKL